MGNLPPSVLRQQPPPPPPPPPRRRRSDGSIMADVTTSMTNKEEGNTEMVVDNCASVNSRTRLYYFRRCKRKRLTNIQSLPDDVVFEILLQLPAQDIYDLARLVCRKWYHMIHTHNFIYAHLQHSTYGLLFQYFVGQDSTFIEMRNGRIEISKINYKLRCPVWTSCNGLILESGVENPYAFYIANPATKQHFGLPLFFRNISGHIFSGIAYAASSMEYKVVLTYFPDDKLYVQECAILTVGVDNSWRNVSTEHLSLTAKELFTCSPLITEGFMHWTGCDTQVLTLDVETEIITETPAPIPQDYIENKVMYHMSTGRYLSLLINCGNFLWEVWEMKPQTGEWTKLPNINLEAQSCTFERFLCKHDQILIPVGWLEYQDVLLFGIPSFGSLAQTCIYYNLHTREANSFELLGPTLNLKFLVHRNSLVWLGG